MDIEIIEKKEQIDIYAYVLASSVRIYVSSQIGQPLSPSQKSQSEQVLAPLQCESSKQRCSLMTGWVVSS